MVAFAPAAWLAEAVATRTQQRLLLSDARGTVWNGSAVPVLTGGTDSRSATLLPGRTSWTLGVRGLALELRVRQPCCIGDELVLRLRPGLGRTGIQLQPSSGSLGEWPAAWLAGLGAPWNTLQLGGTLRLASPGLNLDMVEGRWRVAGQANLDLDNIGSRLSTLDRLGSYRVHLEGSGAGGQGPTITLSTLDGRIAAQRHGAVDRCAIALSGRSARCDRLRKRAGQSAEHPRPAPRCAIPHFDRMNMTQRRPSTRTQDNPPRPLRLRLRGVGRIAGLWRAAAGADRCGAGTRPRSANAPAGHSPALKSRAPVTVNFVNADVEAVTRAMATMIERQIAIDPRVKGTLTLYSDQPLSVREAYLNYLAALRGLGFTMVENNGLLKVVPEAEAKLQPAPCRWAT